MTRIRKAHDFSLTGAGRRRRMILLACALAAPAGQLPAQSGDVRVHDPVIIRQDSLYYIFSTGVGISVKRSSDLCHWEETSTGLGWDIVLFSATGARSGWSTMPTTPAKEGKASCGSANWSGMRRGGRWRRNRSALRNDRMGKGGGQQLPRRAAAGEPCPG